MIQQLFAVFDHKARVFSQPFSVGHVDLAIRAFTEAVHQPGNLISKYPEDHTLFHIGTYDDATGQVQSINPPLNLGLGLNFKKENSGAKVA